MNHKYIVTLTQEEQNELRTLVKKGQTQGYRIKHAQILLKLDEIPENEEWTYAKIKEAYHATPHTICQVAKRFVTGGLEAALGHKEQARQIAQRLEIHYTPIHTSWLNMAEIEIGILSRQCLSQSLRTCIHNRKCRMGEGFFRRSRQIFAGILCVFQENLTQNGGKTPAQAAFEVVNTRSNIF